MCVDLGLLSENFPNLHQTQANVEGVSGCSNSGVPMPDQQHCGCLKGEPPPETPPVLPCASTLENVPILFICIHISEHSFNGTF